MPEDLPFGNAVSTENPKRSGHEAFGLSSGNCAWEGGKTWPLRCVKRGVSSCEVKKMPWNRFNRCSIYLWSIFITSYFMIHAYLLLYYDISIYFDIYIYDPYFMVSQQFLCLSEFFLFSHITWAWSKKHGEACRISSRSGSDVDRQGTHVFFLDIDGIDIHGRNIWRWKHDCFQ